MMYQNNTIEVLASIYDRFIHSLRMQLGDLYDFSNEERDANKKKFITKGSYHFIPCHTHLVLKSFMISKMYFRTHHNKRNISLLDAGCGVGNILVLAQYMGFDVFGLELDDNIIKIAKKHIFGSILSPIPAHIKRPKDLKFITHKKKVYPIAKQDILKYKEYGWYDVIYYYCPFEDKEIEHRFEKQVEEQMKVGAVLAPQLKRSPDIQRDKRFVPLTKAMGLSYKEHREIWNRAENTFVKIKK